jgi:hypothetical protein
MERFSVKLFANVGGSEAFVQQLMEEMPTLVDAGTLPDPKRSQVKDAILTISLEGLLPAFEHLKKIKASTKDSIPELNRKQHYEDFTIALWLAYNQSEQTFEKGSSEWMQRLPGDAGQFIEYLRAQRADWQNDLGAFRNFLQHRPSRESDKYKGHYEPKHAEVLFQRVWHAIANILAVFLSLHLAPGTSLVEIPPEERSAINPRRFKFAIEGFTH